jgi:lipoate-protein ligase A
VVIGRHQNPWVECDLAAMRDDGLPLVRRVSGGGAVYHDGGNTNFSFIALSDRYDQERHFRVVIDGLATLGIRAWKTERNDIRVGERKISGNAFRHTRGRSLHHGTLLVHADLERLTAYLTPSAALIETKATASVRSRVMNLTESRPGLTHEQLWDALAAAFGAEYGEAAGAAEGDGSAVRAEPSSEIAQRARELASWEWVYGHSPAFVRRVRVEVPVAQQATDATEGAGSTASVEIALTVRRGVIREVEGAAAEVERVVRELRDTLVGVRYDRDAVFAAAAADDAGRTGPVGRLLRSLAEEIP